jgi:site-specific DNA-methyltransferase (adenine-specific)
MKDLNTLTKLIPYSSRPDRVSELYNMDCVEGMKMYPDKYFDLAIVDPPYGININHNMGRRKGDKPSDYKPAVWDSEPPNPEYFTELLRVSEHQIVWGANHFISRMPYDSSCWLMWDKQFSEDVSFAQFEMAWTSFDSTCKKYDKHPSQQIRIHPTQKPIDLYKWMLTRYAAPNAKILDTHVGSGSSRIACYLYDYDFTGFEIDKEYCEASEKRFINAISQQSLF